MIQPDEIKAMIQQVRDAAEQLMTAAAAAKDQCESNMNEMGGHTNALNYQAAMELLEPLPAMAQEANGKAEEAMGQIEQASALQGSATSKTSIVPGAHGEVGVTLPCLAADPARLPNGKPAVVEGSPTKQEDLERENKSAAILAAVGYDVEQNPPPRANGKEPDYRIQGEYWDCYSPRGSSTRTIHTAIREKVGRGGKDQQADRIILNLDGCGASPAEIRSRLERSPIRGLREIKIVKDGNVTQFYPWDSEVDSNGD